MVWKHLNTAHRKKTTRKTQPGSAVLWLITFPGESSLNFPCVEFVRKLSNLIFNVNCNCKVTRQCPSTTTFEIEVKLKGALIKAKEHSNLNPVDH